MESSTASPRARWPARTFLRDGHAPAGARARSIAELVGCAASDGERGGGAGRDDADAGIVRLPDLGQEQADADAAGRLERTGDDLDKPLSHARQSQEHEDESLDEDGSQG